MANNFRIIKIDDKNLLGLIALSSSSIDDVPVIQVDYLFVDFRHGKQFIEEIDNQISKYLIVFAIKISENIKKNVGLKYLALYPDAQSNKLISHYRNMGFEKLNKDWMFVKLL
jgi:hypothetical protein